MNLYIRSISVYLLLLSELLLISIPVNAAEMGASTGPTEKISLKDLALPSETQNIEKKPGAFFFSPTSKGKVLVPVNFWGEVAITGIHYIPIDSDLVTGLSLAGGPKSTARLDNITLTRKQENTVKQYSFDLTKGGETDAYKMKLGPGDTVFVERSFYVENRTYYTSLFGVIATILSSVLLYREVKRK